MRPGDPEMKTMFYVFFSIFFIFLGILINHHLQNNSILDTDLKIWNIRSTSSDWHELFNGFGTITYDRHTGIVLQPGTSISSHETHAALMIAKKTEIHPLKDFILSLKVATERQLRQGSANPWEVFWLFFNHTLDRNNNSAANYFIVKPNGIELGKAFDKKRQTILSTRTTPTLTLGKLYSITLIKMGNHVDVSLDGTPILRYIGHNHSLSLFDTPGSIGLYTEDARVHVYNVSIIPLNVAIN